MSTKNRKVLIALKMAGIAGQDKLAGVFHYLNERYGESSPWDVRLVRTKSELTEDALKSAISEPTGSDLIATADFRLRIHNARAEDPCVRKCLSRGHAQNPIGSLPIAANLTRPPLYCG